ncbi:hypothetical protein HPB50_027053 [Hyalomma asiaticum]|uniref:Uncharacterized protein n=1 Tax=Hyalomma asiaticum TaxID=266040 RepID=A0ACB7RVR5_HYAAI|nr:hypothetical protein HPB50_027053 [Hyalomma asiaticum]
MAAYPECIASPPSVQAPYTAFMSTAQFTNGAVSLRFPSANCRGNKASLCCYRAATRPAGGVVRRSCDAGLTNPASAEAAESPRRVRSYAERQGRFGDEVPSSVTLPCECRVSNPSPKQRATSSVAGTEPAPLKVSALETRNVKEAQRGRLNPRHNRHTQRRAECQPEPELAFWAWRGQYSAAARSVTRSRRFGSGHSSDGSDSTLPLGRERRNARRGE